MSVNCWNQNTWTHLPVLLWMIMNIIKTLGRRERSLSIVDCCGITKDFIFIIYIYVTPLAGLTLWCEQQNVDDVASVLHSGYFCIIMLLFPLDSIWNRFVLWGYMVAGPCWPAGTLMQGGRLICTIFHGNPSNYWYQKIKMSTSCWH